MTPIRQCWFPGRAYRLTLLVLLIGGMGFRPAMADPPSTEPVFVNEQAALRQRVLDFERKHFADLKNRYEIERIQAEADVKKKINGLADIGGDTVEGGVSCKAMELKRWAQEQTELEIQNLGLDVDDQQLKTAQEHGEIPQQVAHAVRDNAEFVRAGNAVDAITTQLSNSPANAPERDELEKKLAAARKQQGLVSTEVTDKLMKDFQADLDTRRVAVSKRLEAVKQRVGELARETADIENTKSALANRQADAAKYRERVREYDEKIQDIDAMIREEGSVADETDLRAEFLNRGFPLDIPFVSGKTEFLNGDQITITSVKGTSAERGEQIYQIKGTYTLASHDHALLAASVTSVKPEGGFSAWNLAQSVRIGKGSGNFELLLPIGVQGWPHISFYDNNSFGETYFGSGDSLLKADPEPLKAGK